MPRDARKYLYDIDQAAALIAQFTTGKNFEQYRKEPMLRAAVEREFEIVGEALHYRNSRGMIRRLYLVSANTAASLPSAIS